jgi:hypothetical protein
MLRVTLAPRGVAEFGDRGDGDGAAFGGDHLVVGVDEERATSRMNQARSGK